MSTAPTSTEATITLVEPPVRLLGVLDGVGLWGNLGIGLLLPVRARPWLLLPWAAGFVAYQLTLPTYVTGFRSGWTTWWTARQADLGISPTNGWSASLASLGVAAVLTAVVGLPAALRHWRGVAR